MPESRENDQQRQCSGVGYYYKYRVRVHRLRMRYSLIMLPGKRYIFSATACVAASSLGVLTRPWLILLLCCRATHRMRDPTRQKSLIACAKTTAASTRHGRHKRSRTNTPFFGTRAWPHQDVSYPTSYVYPHVRVRYSRADVSYTASTTPTEFSPQLPHKTYIACLEGKRPVHIKKARNRPHRY